MDFTVPYPQGHNAESAFRSAQDILKRGDLNLPIKGELFYDEDNRKIKGIFQGAEINLTFQETGCLANLKLPLIFQAFRGQIVRSIQKALEKKP